MANDKKQEKENELLDVMYKNVKMGADSIISLLPHVSDGQLKTELTSQLCRYEDYAKQSAELLRARGQEPKEENLMARMGSKMGIAMNTMLDDTASHHAQMIIEGATMGITDMTRTVHSAKEAGVDGDVMRLAKDITAYEEDTVSRMKNYL